VVLRRLSLTLRLFLFYAALVILGGWVIAREVVDEIKPVVRQSTEETLVDAANLLAELVGPDLARGTLQQGQLPVLLARFGARQPHAQIWGIEKRGVSHRVYIVDAHGTVLVDSWGKDVGKDYSRWNDVYLTLRGQYGVRSSRANPNDELSTVMHVAAPVYDGDKVIGSVTVAKPNRTVAPFIHRARVRLARLSLFFVLICLALGALGSFWLSRTIRKLTQFASDVTAGKRTVVPVLPGHEMRHLAESLETMRQELDGKAYVERYAQTLAHELKSPLSAIRGATELLQQDGSVERKERLLGNIATETARLEMLMERVLGLAQVEHRQSLEERVPIELRELILELAQALGPKLAERGVQLLCEVSADAVAIGERFLVRQALSNLLENAVDFSTAGNIRVSSSTEGDQVSVSVQNPGEPIPDYALSRLTERFYSLPRPVSGRKSTGLGLSFVAEVAELHGGTLQVHNVEGGVEARLALPAGRPTRVR
jgi:two-component system, OmpR family, sensor histidine kinase CreC